MSKRVRKDHLTFLDEMRLLTDKAGTGRLCEARNKISVIGACE